MSDIDELNSDLRLKELDRYDIMDTSAEEAFDRITRLASRLFDAKISTVTFIDGHRQWFKSRQGLSPSETRRDVSFCQTPVAEGRPLVVPDTWRDPRFCSNELVCGDPGLRFYAGAPIRGASGAVIGTLCVMDVTPRDFGPEQLEWLVDLAKLVENELELRILASTDGLTQILNRRAFRAEAERAVALAARHRYDLTCIAFDIDHFKAVNDEHGHAVGDLVLTSTVEICRAALRKSDVFGRMGGEEFALVLPHTSPLEGHAVAEKLRLAIEAEIGGRHKGLRTVTASFGIAALNHQEVDCGLLLERADQAMYQAKAKAELQRALAGRISRAPGLARRVLKRASSPSTAAAQSSTAPYVGYPTKAQGSTSRALAASGENSNSISRQTASRVCSVVTKDERHLEVVFDSSSLGSEALAA